MSPTVNTRLAPPPGARLALRCDACDVLWRGVSDEPCWSCGREGRPAAAVIIVPG
jgi:hypothetical protein